MFLGRFEIEAHFRSRKPRSHTAYVRCTRLGQFYIIKKENESRMGNIANYNWRRRSTIREEALSMLLYSQVIRLSADI